MSEQLPVSTPTPTPANVPDAAPSGNKTLYYVAAIAVLAGVGFLFYARNAKKKEQQNVSVAS